MNRYRAIAGSSARRRDETERASRGPRRRAAARLADVDGDVRDARRVVIGDPADGKRANSSFPPAAAGRRAAPASLHVRARLADLPRTPAATPFSAIIASTGHWRASS